MAKSKKAGPKATPKTKSTTPKAASKSKKDEARDERIQMEIIVDAYDEEEQSMGWLNYLEEKLNVPFRAECVKERAISPLKVGEKVDVIAMGPGDECERDMFVTIRWNDRELAVPLAQLKVVKADAQTREAVEDWNYWIAKGHGF